MNNGHLCLWNSFSGSVFASMNYVKRKEPRFIFIQLEEGPLASFLFFFFVFNSIQLIVFKITCSFQTFVCGGTAALRWNDGALHSNYCTNFLPRFAMCPVTLLMNILDICMNNQTAHRRATHLFVRLEMLAGWCWLWFCAPTWKW